MSSHLKSSGRGGAGNIVDSSKAPQLQPEDLQTPTLKSSMVTTGRGGTGNFAAGLDAEEKRRRQDVEPVVRRDSPGATHIGRGGTGNVVKAGAEDTSALASGAAQAAASAATASAQPPPPPSHRTAEMETEQKERASPPVSGNGDAPAAPRTTEEIGWAEKGKNLLFGKK